jgi:hypothetical protein
MRSAFDDKLEKIEKEINKFSQLSRSIKERSYSNPHLKEYAKLIDDCQRILKKNLTKHLRPLIDSLETEDEKDVLLFDFRSRIKRLFDIFYGFLVNSQKVPRELYHLSDIFLDSQGEKADYVVCISEEVAMLPLSHIVRNLGLHVVYPEFWEEVKNRKFYFVQVLPELADTRASLNWPIVIHEIAHIVCFNRKYDDRYFPSISVFHALRTMESLDRKEVKPEEAIVELATKKLYATEILADLLVTMYFGAVFGWRFLREYVDLQDLFEPDRRHPYADIRVQRVADEVKENLRMPQSARFLEQELGSYERTLPRLGNGRVNRPDLSNLLADADKELLTLNAEIRRDTETALTFEKIKQRIRESSWYRMQKSKARAEQKLDDKNFQTFLQQLHKEIIGGKPIVVDPPVVYFLITLGFSEKEIPSQGTKQGRHVLELVADLIRLHAIQEKVFKSKSRSSP